VTETTRQVVVLVFPAVESRTVRIAAGSPHAMASDAELLARAAVATGAGNRVDARL
jgi:hypothetical protein